MNKQICVPVPTEDFLQLARLLRERGSELDPVAAVAYAISYWIKDGQERSEVDTSLELNEPNGGYTWKHKDSQLFLPNNTEIRMRYKGKYHYARVEGDRIVYEGRSVSPAVLVNTITGTSRNAWRDLWIKRPGDKDWAFADRVRRGPVQIATSLADLGL